MYEKHTYKNRNFAKIISNTLSAILMMKYFVKRLLGVIIDGVVSFFLFQIIAGLLAYLCFIPEFQGVSMIWILYYITSYTIYSRTLGQYLFNFRIVDNGNKRSFILRVLLRESTSSLPAIILLLFGWNYLSPIWFLVTLMICSLLSIFRKKIFRISVTSVGTLKAVDEKRIYKKSTAILVSLIILATMVRIVNTMATNDYSLIQENPLYAVPRPSGHSVQKYVDFFKSNQSDIKDYLFGLFERYDYVILCERHHQEMTQYDMIYDIVTDSRFADSIGAVFTEIGCVESRNAYKDFVENDFSSDEEVEKGLAAFMTDNQSIHLLWPNTNWFNFLKKMYYFNHGRDCKVDILFSDRNWLDRTELDSRDSIMAENIISTVRSDSLKKSLIIMNYRHAYLTPGNCGHYISQAFPDRVANVMINFGGASSIPLLSSGKEMMIPIQYGKWDVTFEQIGNPDCAFDFDGSPFGEDAFDHFVLPWNPVRNLRYKDMFTGFIHYKAPAEWYLSMGYNHIFDKENETRFKEREAELQTYYLDYWKEYFKDGIKREDGTDVYYNYMLIKNKVYIGICLFAFLLLGSMTLIKFRLAFLGKVN